MLVAGKIKPVVRVVVMMVNEEYKKDDQVSSVWRSRVERERFNISLSVKQTLEDHTLEQDFWDDESSLYQIEAATLEDRSGSHTGKTIVPPRLSLQSRFLPAMSGSYARKSSKRSMLYPPCTGSFSDYIPATTASPYIPQTEGKVMFTGPGFGAKRSEEYDKFPQLPFPDVFPVTPTPTKFPYRAHTPFAIQKRPTLQEGEHKQRLAGKATRVRLEAVTQSREKGSAPGRQVGKDLDTDELSPVRLMNQIPLSRTHQPAKGMGVGEEASGELQGCFARAARGALSGHGEFACGQSEVIVANTYISLLSVVLVTLTSRPGPVVVQYISLIPHEGFTVHLTAPTSMHTTFNYVILPGELF